MTSDKIQIGDTVRSFDFSRFRDLRGPEAYYVEGVVTAIVNDHGCQRYVIDVTRDVHEGQVILPGRSRVTPHVNGTPMAVGRPTDGVVLVAVGL